MFGQGQMNPQMMQMLMQMMGGQSQQGPQGQMPQVGNMSPQLPIGTPQGGASGGGNHSIPQPMPQGSSQNGGSLQQAVNAGKNLGQLGTWAQNGYNVLSNQFGGGPTGANPGAAPGSPVAAGADGNQYLAQNPNMAMQPSSAFGDPSTSSMFAGGQSGTIAGGGSGMFAGQQSGIAPSLGGEAADSAAADGAAADGSTADWGTQFLDWLDLL